MQSGRTYAAKACPYLRLYAGEIEMTWLLLFKILKSANFKMYRHPAYIIGARLYDGVPTAPL